MSDIRDLNNNKNIQNLMALLLCEYISAILWIFAKNVQKGRQKKLIVKSSLEIK